MAREGTSPAELVAVVGIFSFLFFFRPSFEAFEKKKEVKKANVVPGNHKAF